MKRTICTLAFLILFLPAFKVYAETPTLDTKVRSKVLNAVEKKVEALVKDKDYLQNNSLADEVKNKSVNDLQQLINSVGTIKDRIDTETNSVEFNKELNQLNNQFKEARFLVSRTREMESIKLLGDFSKDLKNFNDDLNQKANNKANSVENINSITKNLEKTTKTLQDEDLLNNDLSKEITSETSPTLDQIDRVRSGIKEELRKYKAALVSLHKIYVLIS